MNGKSGNRPETRPEKKDGKGGLPVLGFANDGKWTAWLEKYHLASKGLEQRQSLRDALAHPECEAAGNQGPPHPNLYRHAQKEGNAASLIFNRGFSNTLFYHGLFTCIDKA